VSSVCWNGNAVITGDTNDVFDSLAEILTIVVSEAIVPGIVQGRLIGPRLDAKRVESLWIGVKIRAESRFVLPIVVEANQVETCDKFEISRISMPRRVGIIDRRAADRDRKPAEKRFDVSVGWMSEPVRSELGSTPGYRLLLVVRIRDSPALAGVLW
jgi:hypothetical protein